MDEPTSSLTLSETDRLLRVIADLKAARRQRHLHLAPPATRSSAAPTASWCCATAAWSASWTAAAIAPRRDDPPDDRPRPEVALHRRRPRRRGERCARARGAAHRDLSRTSRSACRCAAARSSASPAWSAPAAPSWRASIFGIDPPARRRASRLDGAAVADRRAARRHRPRHLPGARGPQALRPAARRLDRREHLAARPRRLCPRPCIVQPRAGDRQCRAAARAASTSGRPSVATEVGTLSGGNQQKVVLAKWLSMRPRVIIFDEPTRGIDVGAKSEIYALMRGLADGGVAILMISSDMEEVIGVSDRIAVMHEGAISGLPRARRSSASTMCCSWRSATSWQLRRRRRCSRRISACSSSSWSSARWSRSSIRASCRRSTSPTPPT